ncbi:MAG: cation:proton antiporter [Acidimicrobiales bacterium]|nr:cation:proton antiporter [Acidimicrobiales bacterium]
MFAAGSATTALAFIEVGAVVLVLGLLARISGRLGITAVPFYLIAGLAFGDGGLAEIEVSESFVALAAEIGVLLLLFTLGLEYSESELKEGLRTGLRPGLLDMCLNASPGFLLGLVLGWEPLAAALLAGVTWISSSGVVSKVLSDLGRLGNRETPAVLNLLVIEDLAMAVYLPLIAALIVGGSAGTVITNVTIALVAVMVILAVALRFGGKLSAVLAGGSDEALLLGVFGITLLVAGGAQALEVSGAIGAFLVGLAISGPTEERALRLMSPLRDLFAATFFVFFSFQIDPSNLVSSLPIAVGLFVVTALTKGITGWYGAGLLGVGPLGRSRAGTVLIARGEFSIVIAALGSELADGPDLGALAAGYVLLTAIGGPLASKYYELLPLPRTRPGGRLLQG